MFEMILRDVFAGTCDNFGIPQMDNKANDVRFQSTSCSDISSS